MALFGPAEHMLAPRSIASFPPGRWERRMGQSALTHILRGPTGGLPPALSGHRFETPLGVDHFDEGAARQVVSYLRTGGKGVSTFPIADYLRPVAGRVRFSAGVTPENDDLINHHNRLLCDTIDRMPALSVAAKERLKRGMIEPSAIHTRILEITMDDGKLGTFLAWRVQGNRWPATDIWTGGGLRESTDMGPALARFLQSGMDVKNILHNLGFGGAKGGIACDPDALSDREQERLLRAYSAAFSTAIAVNRDKPAGDIGTTDSKFMDWLQEGLDDVLDQGVAPGSFTGKTYVPGKRARGNGTPLRGIATGLGAFFAMQALKTLVSWHVGGRLLVQGAGNAGMEFAILAADAGLCVVGINDTRHAWIKDSGLTPDELRKIQGYKAKKCALGDVPVVAVPSAALLDRIGDVDVYIPAGAHRSNGVDEVRRLKRGSLVVPMSNHPLKPEAEAVVAERERAGEILCMHDGVSSGGGVASSSVEARQNLNGQAVTEGEERAFIRDRMDGAVTAVFERSRRDGVSTAEAAFTEAIARYAAIMPTT